MARYLATIEQEVREMLRDEVEIGQDQEFADDEVKSHIRRILSRIVASRPYSVREELTTTDGSKELDISDITNLIKIRELEYPVGNDPRDLITYVPIDENTILMKTSVTPGGSETVYAFCDEAHTLTESSTTLNYMLEELLIRGTAASLAQARGRDMMDKVNVGGGASPVQMVAWGNTMMALFKQELRQSTPPNQKMNHPEDEW